FPEYPFIVVLVLRNWVGRSGTPTIRLSIDNRLIKAAHTAISYGYRSRYPTSASTHNPRLSVYALF
ncbi:hypothetical protein NS800_32435, partial [Pseudomonas aeruginosa]|nr:hypothetical protein [Pseudomonas aeruginosa]